MFIQVWRRSTKPCADQRGPKLPAWNTYAKLEQKQAYLPTRNTEKGVYNFLHKHIPSLKQHVLCISFNRTSMHFVC